MSEQANAKTELPIADSEEHGLLRSLIHASYWLDDGLQAYMQKHARIALPRAQSMAMIYLTEGVDRPSDLAGKLDVSKQAAQQLLKALVQKGIVEVRPDPANGRQKQVVFTEYGRELQGVARRGLFHMEAELKKRIGSQHVLALRRALDLPWGDALDWQEKSRD